MEEKICSKPSCEDLGAATAAAMRGGDQQEPERHVLVSGQVRGYLRWYGDLSALKGYWPLAETIVQALNRAGAEREALSIVLEQHAQDWKCKTATVRAAVNEVVSRAMELHPDFFSQVLGGLSAPHHALPFVKASVHWLTIHRLALSRDGAEAYWQFWPLYRMSREAQYISSEDYQIVREHGAGRTFAEIAEELDYPVEEVKKIYEQTLERAELIVRVAHGGTGQTIGDYLKSIGISSRMEGAKELETAVRLTQADPSYLKNVGGKLYPAVAGELGIKPGQASTRIRKVLNSAFLRNRESGQFDEFYRDAGIQGRGTRVQAVIATLLRYIESGSIGEPHYQG